MIFDLLYRSKLKYAYLVGLILVPVVLLILPADFFDEGQSLCMSMLLFDQRCPGCGMTRAIQHLLHGELSVAASFNKMAFVVLPVLLWVWTGEVRKVAIFSKKKNKTNT